MKSELTVVDRVDLCSQAIKYFQLKEGQENIAYKPIFLDFVYIPPFLKDGQIYLHCPSIISYCHKFQPSRFHRLTQSVFCSVFTESKQISFDGVTHQFRVINLPLFNQIISE